MEERESRRPKGISEAGRRRRGASSAQLADGDAWHAEMRALPLAREKTGGTGFQNRCQKCLAKGFGRVSLINGRD